jgi:putative endonuclease
LIAARGNTVVFCEVKTRSGSGYGAGAEAVGPHKRRRLRVLASRWLREARGSGRIVGSVEVRFDVASLRAGPDGYGIDLIEGAF